MQKITSTKKLVTKYWSLITSPRGFTLIEVLLVMGVTSILLVMGTINMLGYIGGQNLESEARAITALLRDAQSKAMSQEAESRWGVYLYNNAGEQRDYYVIFQADEALVSSSTYTDVPGTSLERKTMRSNVEFTSPAEATSTIILFTKVSGQPNASTTAILQRVDNASSQKTIYISGNGKIDYE
jgi:prepilin-type N-terminal cleavage/methylation domain-containing protein